MILLNNVSKTVTSGSEKLTILHAVYLTVPRGQTERRGDGGTGRRGEFGVIFSSPHRPVAPSPRPPVSEEEAT